MVGPRWQALASRGEGVGELVGPDVVVGRAEHPVCGDVLELSLRVVAGVVTEARWRASGCPATVAVAALAAATLPGTALAAAAAALRQAVAGHGGLAATERHAEAMALRALAAAGA